MSWWWVGIGLWLFGGWFAWALVRVGGRSMSRAEDLRATENPSRGTSGDTAVPDSGPRDAPAVAFRVWWCGCDDFYTGSGVSTLNQEKPPADRCHQMANCGWRWVLLLPLEASGG
jgi:hypothetical protein